MDTPTREDIVGVPTFNPSIPGGRDDNVPMSEIDPTTHYYQTHLHLMMIILLILAR